MKLNITEVEAYTYSTILASFFVLAVYIWKPIFNPPYDIKKLRKDGQLVMTREQRRQVELFEIKMRSMSVGTLCLGALIFFILIADHSKRVECSMISWFGLKIDADAIRFTVCGLALNSVLYMGEIF